VLVDSKRQEIVALAIDSAGTLYAAAVGETHLAAAAEGAGVTVTVTAEAPAGDEAKPEAGPRARDIHAPGGSPAPAAPVASPPAPGAELWRIDPDGFGRPIWTTKSETVYALAPEAGRGVWVGTGPDGSLYRIDPEGRATWYGKVGPGPISSLASSAGRLCLLGSSPSRLASLGPKTAASGTIESRVFDARFFSRWGILRWVLDPGVKTGLAMAVRSGNTEEPDATWSDWAPLASPSSSSDEGPVAAPPGRFVQWRATFTRTQEAGPSLSEVELRFRPRNLAPRVENVAILPAGAAFQAQPTGAPPGTETPFLSNRYAEDVLHILASGHRQPPNLRRFVLPGARTVTWEGQDDNGDELVYDVLVSGRDEELWRPLAKRLPETFLTWDARSLADGWYRLKIIATDTPNNPAEETLTGERTSEPFVVDNTPPTLSALEVTEHGRKAVIAFRASDTEGRIGYAEYAIDSGEWRILIPEDRVEDQRSETYRFEVDLPGSGARVIAVRVADEGGNWTTAQAIVGK